MKRFPVLLAALSLSIAIPSLARVVSYAPYTSRVGLPSFQDRTSRHFVLIESTPEDFLHSNPREVVLYDSTGAEEPRVITPAAETWVQTALYQKDGGTPLILAVADGLVMISEGGSDWRKVEGLGTFRAASVADVDTGGPFANGLFAPIVLGNDEWPFVVTLKQRGVWAIRRTGEAKALLQANDAQVIGRNAAGDRFLVHSLAAVWTATPDGALTKTADVGWGYSYTGWITSSGAAYLEALNEGGRSLCIASGTELELVASAAPAYPADSEDPVPLRVFAIPTADYDGAWILERAPGRPTSLYRHTPSGGLETMWIDETGPQVEALIAGASGQTLLIQVHRERESSELSKPFIDPALAVWRIGQPAPRAYDELYLNEEWNKGFVVVDADRIESGDAFVFNSGFKEIEVPVSRVSAPIGGGGDVKQEWGVVRGSLKQRLVLPGVARLRGAHESFWQTDVTLYNPLPERQQLEVRFVSLGVENAISTMLTLEPHEIRAIPDVLKTLFLIDNGGGSLHLVPAIGVNATARTYSRKGNGTVGYGMHAIDYFNAAGPRFPLTFSGAFPGEHFRTNVLLTDTSGRGTHANLRTVSGWYADESAGEMGTPAAGAMQSTVPTPSHVYNGIGASLVVAPSRGNAIATVVAIDNRSNDPTWFPPDVPGSVPRAIPIIGHLEGGNAEWRSDLYLQNPRNGARWVILTARLWDAPGSQLVRWVYLHGRETLVVRDALKELFGVEGIARLRYHTPENGEGVRVTSRTYAVEQDGATYGCLVPPLNGFQIATAGDRLEILGAGGGAGYRTNVGLVDLADNTTTNPRVRVKVVGDRNEVLATMLVEIPARGGRQLNDIFRERGIAPPPAALLVVEVLEGQQIAAYATLVDNATNDATYLSPQLGAKETN